MTTIQKIAQGFRKCFVDPTTQQSKTGEGTSPVIDPVTQQSKHKAATVEQIAHSAPAPVDPMYKFEPVFKKEEPMKNTPVKAGQEIVKITTVRPVDESKVDKAVVAFVNVTKRFEDKIALDNVSFTVRDEKREGRIICMVGQSGCGKSTLLRMIAGLKPHFPPTIGSILIDGSPAGEPSAERGLVDQKYSLFPHLTVEENIAFGLELRGVAHKERQGRAMEWVKKVGLEGSETKFPYELSGGMQQRVSIAATLILAPKILLMDEPFGALDPKIRLRMQELLVQLWREQKATIFFVTHSIEEAVYLGDRVFRMGANPGRLVEELQVPRPDEPPEIFRTRSWFNDIVGDLRLRLEQDAPAKGELGNNHDHYDHAADH